MYFQSLQKVLPVLVYMADERIKGYGFRDVHWFHEGNKTGIFPNDSVEYPFNFDPIIKHHPVARVYVIPSSLTN